MMRCPKCSAETADGSRFCPSCATALDASSSAPTQTSIDDGGTPVTSHPSLDRTRFVPGAVLDKRYRIIGLLGRGGMGEVYRADDLKLGQPVALKFLPSGLERDENRLNRFLNEVRTARLVTHSNVCRVFDIGEADGQHFLTMEYVDGEDLSSLLRRIGRLPKDKAMQIARQLCAGVQAAHEQRILHRDLKPANVMIDGRGRVKITDFGLASLEQAIQGKEIGSGTPAYMAPEQLAGKEVTVRSDIYALGLVLYELFTGKQAFEAATPAELARLQRDSTPTSPASHVEGFDPAVERIIQRCLEVEPLDRPASALAVAAALPGGDPLAAALAAGETPSPEMVADAGATGALRPAIATLCLALILVGLAGRVFLAEGASLPGQVSLELPPEALSVEARKIIDLAGYDEPPVDTAYGFEYDQDYLEHVREQPAQDRWKDLALVRPTPIYFWYRQSPRHLTTRNYESRVRPDDPPAAVSGMIGLRLDSRGTLLRFGVVPPQIDDTEDPGVEPDWSFLFEAAGLDIADFVPTTPRWNPLFDCDLRRAWDGAYPDRRDVAIRVEAGAWRGRAVLFEVLPPWSKPWRQEQASVSSASTAQTAIMITLMLCIVLGGFVLARRNLLLGRGDRPGAFRVSLFIFASFMIGMLLTAHHEPTINEVGMVFEGVVWSLFFAALIWMVYIALEPYVRRLWPHSIISWNRLLRGRFRDPLIGRDVLIGALCGVVLSILFFLSTSLLPKWMDLPAGLQLPSLMALGGTRQAVAELSNFSQTIGDTMGYLFALLLFRVILRRLWAAAGLLVLILATVATLNGVNPLIDAPFALLYWSVQIIVLMRLGMIGFLSLRVFLIPSIFLLHTTNVSAWYAGRTLLVPLLLAALAAYAFYVSLGGRSLLSDEFLEAETTGQ